MGARVYTCLNMAALTVYEVEQKCWLHLHFLFLSVARQSHQHCFSSASVSVMMATCPVVPREKEIGQTIHTCRMPKYGVVFTPKSFAFFCSQDMYIHLWSAGRVFYCSQYASFASHLSVWNVYVLHGAYHKLTSLFSFCANKHFDRSKI